MRGIPWPGCIFAYEDACGVAQQAICTERVQRGRSAGAVLTVDVRVGFFLASDVIEIDAGKALPPKRKFPYDPQSYVFACCGDVGDGHIYIPEFIAMRDRRDVHSAVFGFCPLLGLPPRCHRAPGGCEECKWAHGSTGKESDD